MLRDNLRCELLDVDGDLVRVRLSGDATLTIEDMHALRELVTAVRRRYAIEHEHGAEA